MDPDAAVKLQAGATMSSLAEHQRGFLTRVSAFDSRHTFTFLAIFLHFLTKAPVVDCELAHLEKKPSLGGEGLSHPGFLLTIAVSGG